MDEELIDVVLVEETSDSEIIETVEVIDVTEVETYTIESDSAFPALGESNESLRHPLLTHRELNDQHPITAITGLREELDSIEALQTIYSDKRNQADYYLWEDGNILQEDRVGLFVSLCEDTNTIKLSSMEDDIFGVTVDGAGFVGGQDDISRDISYGLVVHSGVVAVQCESDVNVGDHVITNSYGFATKTDNIGGYKVVSLIDDDGVLCAVIALGDVTSRMHALVSDVDALVTRVENNETNIVAAINVATQAHNLAKDIEKVSVETVQKADDALANSESAIEKTDQMDTNVSSAMKSAAEARAIAESAMVHAETIRNEASATANDALTNVNNLIKELEPITTWEDTATGNTGAEYFTTYVKDGVATKAEIQTVETMTNDNKSAIEKNAESFRTLVSSIDKYSVGEYSQAYGLTREQAKSILKEGMIYVPTKHNDSDSHSETFADESEPQWFTPGGYYEWDGTDWIEYGNSVAFFSEEPAPSRALQFWYIDSDEAPNGYEARALYKYENWQWVKVNIFYNNPSNRMVSSISQEVDNVSLEVVNARESVAALDIRVTATESEVQTVAGWMKDPDGNVYNLATIKQTADDAGASVALVVEEKDGEKVVNAGSIVMAINTQDKDSESFIKLSADVVDIDAGNISLKGQTIKISADDVLGIQSPYFSVDTDGYMTATGGDIGGWIIDDNALKNGNLGESDSAFMCTGTDESLTLGGHTDTGWVFGAGTNFGVTNTGNLYASGGQIGNWSINNTQLQYKDDTYWTIFRPGGVSLNCTDWKSRDLTIGVGSPSAMKFGVTIDGAVYASDITIKGGSMKIGSYFNVDTDGKLTCTGGTIGGWEIDGSALSFSQGDFTAHLSPNRTAALSICNAAYQSLFEVYNAGGCKIKCGSDNYFSIYYEDSVYGMTLKSNVGKLQGTWYGTSNYAVTSDVNKKNTITDVADKYNVFFDNVTSRTFKYNDGTSDRLHTGFIAQEVKDALDVAELDTTEFGGLVIKNNGDDTQDWYLRYEEFISLNTWQIQKLKARVAELERKIEELGE